ncbi:MAG: hypothetical protein ACYS21_19260, partial [Planctomycetota bacterium]
MVLLTTINDSHAIIIAPAHRDANAGLGGLGGVGDPNGPNGLDGHTGPDWSMPLPEAHGGGSYYGINCTATLTSCEITHSSASNAGGGEYYNPGCNGIFNSCAWHDNTAGLSGGGQYFGNSCSV